MVLSGVVMFTVDVDGQAMNADEAERLEFLRDNVRILGGINVVVGAVLVAAGLGGCDVGVTVVTVSGGRAGTNRGDVA